MRFVLLIIFIISNAIVTFAHSPYIKKGEPGENEKWGMIWHDEFSRHTNFDSAWLSENKAPSHILSSRWRENVNIKRGKLELLIKKEQKKGKDWTSGSITCKQKFKYGYYECRMKIAAAAATNNSFWLYQWNKTNELPAFEIDVVEGHYPNDMNSNIHNRGVIGSKKIETVSNHCYLAKNLWKKYHTYGLWWTEDWLVFYLDGRAIWQTKNDCCFQEANLVIGNAVITWAGEITDSINGTAMSVDYVRVWKKNE